ncbi:hypothetical protein HMPREF0043_00739 [Actinobaculum sp. oral taxon 183 str. F0552]|nr:hypothetical protein HMPREF0043_00739 [Actinobaculum sp. oral taxon 183 str. F0552]
MQRRAPSGATAGDGGVRGGETAGRMRRYVVSAPPGSLRAGSRGRVGPAGSAA